MQIIYFLFKEFYVPLMTLQSIGFKFFAKIMKGSCVFCCSSCISFNSTSHLKCGWVIIIQVNSNSMIMHWQGEKTASMEIYYANSSALLEDSKKMLKRLLFRIKKWNLANQKHSMLLFSKRDLYNTSVFIFL